MTELYDQYRPAVYRYLYYRVGEKEQAEDLMADVFLRVLEKLPQYRQNHVPFQAWLFKIARNLAVDHFRRVNSHPSEPLDPNLIAEQEGPEQATERHLTAQHLQDALRSLTADQCDVIVFRFLVGMSISQAAEALNKSEGAVKALQARGLEALQRTLSWRILHDARR
jgi:RNA polymerase sigma-70 factor (ECF subfamily)